MKRLAYTVLAVMMLVSAIKLPALAQSEETRQVSDFNSIVSGEVLSVHVKIDGTESLKISARADIIKVIETVVENGTLKIKFKDNLKSGEGDSDGPIDIYVTAKSLSSLVKEGSGYLTVDGPLTGGDVSIISNGSGIVRASVESGNFKVTINGPSNVGLSGAADKAEVTITGPGTMNGRDLKTKDASVMITGAGSAYFGADKTVSAHIAGSGGVVYSGDATVTESKIDGSGTISKAN